MKSNGRQRLPRDRTGVKNAHRNGMGIATLGFSRATPAKLSARHYGSYPSGYEALNWRRNKRIRRRSLERDAHMIACANLFSCSAGGPLDFLKPRTQRFWLILRTTGTQVVMRRQPVAIFFLFFGGHHPVDLELPDREGVDKPWKWLRLCGPFPASGKAPAFASRLALRVSSSGWIARTGPTFGVRAQRIGGRLRLWRRRGSLREGAWRQSAEADAAPRPTFPSSGGMAVSAADYGQATRNPRLDVPFRIPSG